MAHDTSPDSANASARFENPNPALVPWRDLPVKPFGFGLRGHQRNN
jgi:hypothetical protein